MEALIVLGLGIFVFIVIGVPVLMVSHLRLLRRVRELESRMGLGSDKAVAPAKVQPARHAAPPQTPYVEKEDGPWARPKLREDTAAPAPSTTPKDEPPRAVVFRTDRFLAFGRWLRENWFLGVAALSLSLAGVFLVQYGVEQGLLTPTMRVVGALSLGAALIIVGDVLRRRYGDENSGAMTFLPGVLSGAGLISLFAGVLAARVMYDLIGAGTALAGLVAVSGLAMVLGWFYGPVLAAVGIVGATAAPFIVGGQSDSPEIFYYYFTLIALAGLGVDSAKRWAWISALVLIATFAGAWLLFSTGVAAQHYLAFACITALGAVHIPERRLVPHHQGSTVSMWLLPRQPDGGHAPSWPGFPTRLAAGAVAAATGVAVLVVRDTHLALTTWQALAALSLIFAYLVLATRAAPALVDLAVLPAFAALSVVYLEFADSGALFEAFRLPPPTDADPELPLAATILVAGSAIGSVLAFLRMWPERGGIATYWALLSAALSPAMVVVLELGWRPADMLGSYPWAGHAMAVAALMTILAERAARRVESEADRLRPALFALSALVMASLALMLMLSDAALTLAIALMVMLAAEIDRRFDLRALGLFIQVGAIVTGWRLVFDPGIDWAMGSATLIDVLAAYTGAIALLTGAWFLVRQRGRKGSAVILESAVWTLAGVFATVLLDRFLGVTSRDTHWGYGLMATVWAISMMNQLYRLKVGDTLARWVRWVLAVVFGLVTLSLLVGMALFANPLAPYGDDVVGPVVANSLAVAYLPLAVVFGVGSWKLAHVPKWMRRGFAGVSALFVGLYLGLAIRHAWWGPSLSTPSVKDGELYSYTVAMLTVSALALWVAFSRRSVELRKLAVLGVALTIAKVFLIDMSGLTGLIRVASFLGLGLALAALAWLNRKMSAQWDRDPTQAP